MNKEKQLIKNTAIVSIGKICTQLITFFLLPLYTAVLSTKEYGVVDLLNTLIGLLIPIVTLQIEQGVFRYLLECRGEKKEQKRIISSTFIFLVMQSIIYLIGFLIVSQWIHNDYKYFLAINLIANIFSTIFLQISRGLGDNTSYAVGSFLSGVTTVILNVIFIVVLKMGAYGILTATLIGNIACIIYIVFHKKIYKQISLKEVDKSTLKEILKYSVPLVPNMISWWVVNASDRTIISAVLGIAQNGIYSAANKFSVFSTIFLQISRGLGDNTSYAVGSFLSGVTTVILNVIFIVVLKMGAYGILTATLIGNIACIIYIVFHKKIYKQISLKEVDKSTLKEILKYSVPLVPNMISWWVVNASDRTIISAVLGIAQNGIYSAANKFSAVFSTLYSVFNLTWTESAVLNIDAEDRDKFFSKMLDFNIRFFGALCLGVIASMPFVFPILINSKFDEAYYQIPILLIGTMFSIMVSFLGSIYVAKKLTKEIAKTSILAAVINIGINIIAIKWLGLYAASISTAIAYISMTTYRVIDSRKYVKLTISKRLIISLVTMTAITMIFYYTKNYLCCLLMLLIVVIYTVFINRKNVKFIVNTIKQKIKK